LKIIPFSSKLSAQEWESAMSILWTIIIGFVAGVIARFLHPGNKYEPKGFILTTLLGIVGAFVATYLGQAVGWYQAGEGAGFIGAIVGAIIVLVVWGLIAPRLERNISHRNDRSLATLIVATAAIGPTAARMATMIKNCH
jgi:uncharacterized membrane protein YeaQ/YmgE (transglycosylase-associated protein family)